MAGVRKRLGSILGPRGVMGPQGPRGLQGPAGANGIPTDEAVAINMEVPSETSAALGRALQSFRSAAGGAAGTDRIASLRDFGLGTCRIAVVSDSTANDANDWLRIWCREFGLTLPSRMRREYHAWSDGTQAWTTTVDAPGVGTPASGGVVLNDTFTRTASDLVGSTSDNGKVWAGTAGKWTVDGASAVPSATGGGVAIDAGARDAKVTVNAIVVTSAPAAIINRRVYLGASGAALLGNGVWAQFSISTTGNPSLSLWKTVGGVNSQIGATNFATGVVANSATPQAVKVELELSIQNVSVKLTVGGSTVTISGTITESDYAGLGRFAGIADASGGAPSTANKVDSVVIETPFVPASYDGLTVLNGSVGGASLAYQQSRLATMFPASAPVDVLIIATGHNYGTLAPDAFLATVGGFLDAWFALHPRSKVLFTSQNPQFAPAAAPAAHAARQVALRAWAADEGHEYLPVFERFVAEPDGGASLVSSDGIHPTTPPVGDLTQWSGARLWADLMVAAVEGRTIRT